MLRHEPPRNHGNFPHIRRALARARILTKRAVFAALPCARSLFRSGPNVTIFLHLGRLLVWLQPLLLLPLLEWQSDESSGPRRRCCAERDERAASERDRGPSVIFYCAACNWLDCRISGWPGWGYVSAGRGSRVHMFVEELCFFFLSCWVFIFVYLL